MIACALGSTGAHAACCSTGTTSSSLSSFADGPNEPPRPAVRRPAQRPGAGQQRPPVVLLTTVEGAPIDAYSYSALGDSGFDYRQAYVSAVPEPTPAALFAGGLFALLALRRR